MGHTSIKVCVDKILQLTTSVIHILRTCCGIQQGDWLRGGKARVGKRVRGLM